MIPNGAEGIGHLATRIVVETMPKAVDAYMAADLGMVAGLLGMVAQDYDRAADVLTADDAEIHGLFETASTLPLDPRLKVRIAAALTWRPAGLRVSQLSAHLDVMMRVLIELHAAVEDAGAEGAHWAAPFDAQIWTFLENHVARRAYDSAF